MLADQHGSEVIVERHVRGDEHRLLVVGGKVVAAARGAAAWVTGDGRSTVRELIDSQLNTDPRRGTTEDFPLNRIDVAQDDVVRADLQRQGLTPDSVPAAGKRVLIQRNGNVAVDCSDAVHPEVDHVVSLAARTVGLDIAGVDVVAEDISRPLHEQGGAVVEVNAGPGLLMHLRPAEGAPQPVGRAIVDHLFPDPEDSGRIPIVGVAGSRHTTQIARLLAWVMQLGGRHVGLACRDGLYLDRRLVEAGDCTHWDAGRRLLINRNVEAAVFENDAAAILSDGLAYDRCTIGIVTDLGGIDALAGHDVHDDDQMLKVLRTQVDVVLADGVAVLNAGDERVAGLARLCDGGVVLYALDEHAPALLAQRAAGARAVFLRDGDCVLAEGPAETLLPRLAPLSAQADTLAPEALLAAVASAWAMGVVTDLITAGVQTFGPAPANARASTPHAVIDNGKAAA